MTTKYGNILCDADFLIALYVNTDSNHAQATEIYNQNNNFAILNITLYEISTVLSRLFEHKIAKKTLIDIQDLFLNIITFDQSMEKNTFSLYYQLDKKNISFFDCACLSVAKKNNWKIASFDKFYPPEILV